MKNTKLKTSGVLKVFVLLALLTQVSGGRGLSGMLDSGKDIANLQEIKREKSGSTFEVVEPLIVETSAEAAATVVTPNSFGKMKVGMTVRQASQTLGTKLVAPNGTGECYYVEPQGKFKAVDFMVIKGKIARIDIKNKSYVTDRGAKIGDTEARIKSLYKGVVVNPQKYDEKLHDMEVYSDDKKYLIIFETDGKIVTGYRVGRAEEVSWVERCG